MLSVFDSQVGKSLVGILDNCREQFQRHISADLKSAPNYEIVKVERLEIT